MEGKIFVRLQKGKDEKNWQLSVGCDIPGKWILHWGVSFVGDNGRLDSFFSSFLIFFSFFFYSFFFLISNFILAASGINLQRR